MIDQTVSYLQKKKGKSVCYNSMKPIAGLIELSLQINELFKHRKFFDEAIIEYRIQMQYDDLEKTYKV